MKNTKIVPFRIKFMLPGLFFVGHTLAFLMRKRYSVRNSESETIELREIIVVAGIAFALRSSLIENQYVKCIGNLLTGKSIIEMYVLESIMRNGIEITSGIKAV
jgi:hypothetical protein